ncbi:MAG: triose-phosphate isomerase [Clostridiales bacterium]|jgi:triosephosphate isomerase|nr:triose-phosphate isomerase [Clostridiales bacterium]MDR2751767.1 triose-phosphate isomerase [Clostridiales bacterium]
MRKKIIAGNWKMNYTPKETKAFIDAIKDKVSGTPHEVVFCVPYVDLATALEAVKGTDIKIGAQNIHQEDKGAFTGEISADMLVEIGVTHVVIGHSERRQYFGETDLGVNAKAKKSLAKGLVPIICVGESLDQRKQGVTIDIVRLQTRIAFLDIPEGDAKKCVVAYEPIWAIGTGLTASSDQAEEACKAIRDVLGEIYGTAVSDEIRIQYGGSVTASNASELFKMPDIDGGLVGGASLKPDFEKIVNF